MGSLEAVIFDLDGVIVDSEPRHEQAFRVAFDELGYGSNHGIDFPAYYGRSDQALWLDFIEKHHPPETLPELSRRKQNHFLRLIRETEPIFPAIPALVRKLADRYSLGIASGSPHEVIEAVLAMQDLRRFFSVTVSATDVPNGKPAPDIFLRAAALLSVPPSRVCVIEDSSAGVAGAISAGMRVIAITNSLPTEQLQRATAVVSGYAEVEKLLLPVGE